MRVEVAWVGGAREVLVALDLAEGTSVDDAVAKALPELAWAVRSGELVCAIFGRRVERDAQLRDGDRLEVTRPLAVDPKTARRRRAARQR
ncbi:MAG TPA: RnfH family protein [Casimicrobiaceae bacterium]|jgi:putative ubiquitin-RnfH superfamily antitoxin RatB of RatAB toxin-antitoxin module|nr:RnfH family protein [Casimicrobiaceae bacterium]